MLNLGTYQELVVVKRVQFGIYLAEKPDAQERVLLPEKQVPQGTKIGDTLIISNTAELNANINDYSIVNRRIWFDQYLYITIKKNIVEKILKVQYNASINSKDIIIFLALPNFYKGFIL